MDTLWFRAPRAPGLRYSTAATSCQLTETQVIHPLVILSFLSSCPSIHYFLDKLENNRRHIRILDQRVERLQIVVEQRV